MLAQRFSRIREFPVRYGINPPRENTAVQNYIATALRAFDVPAYVHGLTRPRFIGGAPMYRPEGVEGVALKGMMRTGDPSHLAVLGDLLQDRGVAPHFDPSSPLTYQVPPGGHDSLSGLLGAILHINQQAADPQNSRAFHPANFNSPQVAGYLSELMGMPGIPGNAYYRKDASRTLDAYHPHTVNASLEHVLGNYERNNHPQTEKLRSAIGGAQTGNVPNILHLYNMLAHGLHGGAGTGNLGEFHGTEDLTQLLHHHAIPALRRSAAGGGQL